MTFTVKVTYWYGRTETVRRSETLTVEAPTAGDALDHGMRHIQQYTNNPTVHVTVTPTEKESTHAR